jgi:hypothetical protein
MQMMRAKLNPRQSMLAVSAETFVAPIAAIWNLVFGFMESFLPAQGRRGSPAAPSR